MPRTYLNPGEFYYNDGMQVDAGHGVSLLGTIPGVLTALGIGTIASGLTASGNTQATALPVSAAYNVFSTVASGASGAIVVAGGANPKVVLNEGTNALALFPPSGSQLGALGVNATATIASGGGVLTVLQASATQYYYW